MVVNGVVRMPRVDREGVLRRNSRKARLRREQRDSARYGTDYVVEFAGIPLTVERIASVSFEEREQIAVFLFDWFRKRGFPYPSYDNVELDDDLAALRAFDAKNLLSGNAITGRSRVGTKVCKHFCPHFFTVSDKSGRSMIDAFADDGTLMKVIRNRLGITFFYRGESYPFAISGNMLRQGFRSTRSCATATTFPASVAKLVWEMIAPPGGIVYDFSVGFCGRLLGAVSSDRMLRYVGVDPWKEVVSSSYAVAKRFGLDVAVSEMGSEAFRPDELIGKVDAAFSSPPYYSREIYDHAHVGQAYSNRTYDEFLRDYWSPTASNLAALLRPGGKLALNVAEVVDGLRIFADMSRVLCDVGFDSVGELRMTFSKSHLSGKVGTDDLKKSEPIGLFERRRTA